MLPYLNVLKPRETGLLAFIGVAAAFIAARGHPPLGLLGLVLLTVLIAAAGANGLTNYLDRELDALMPRTRRRALPAGRIRPPQKVLPLVIGLSVAGLALAWWLHPFAFGADLVGTAAAVVWRKRVTCVFPQGVLASCAPVLMGWFAVRPAFSLELGLLCLMVAVWLPLHVWSIMVANREEYLGAGIGYFPVCLAVRPAARVLLAFAVMLYAASVALYFAGGFGWLYLLAANGLGVMVVYGGFRLVTADAFREAWRLYKLSAFPYLGLIFLAMCLDVWLLG